MCVQLQFHFPPIHIVLPRIAIIVMALPIDEALPQALLPRVDGQVEEAKATALPLACILFDNQGQSNIKLIEFSQWHFL